MPSCRASRFWPVCIAAIISYAVPPLLWSESNLLSPVVSATTDRPFAGSEYALTKAVDAILAADPAQPSAGEAPNENPASQWQQQSWSAKNVGVIASASRLKLLRPAIEPILRQSGVPVELAAVILVESGGRTAALSPKGARGLWQLMPDTARRYGLRVDEIQDDRLDTEKSTRAAAHYLRDLHLQFASWTLALAAYNTGERNVQQAISRSQSTEFAVMSSLDLLPLETRNYVPRVLAVIRSLGQPLMSTEHHSASGTTVFSTNNH